MKLKWSSTLLVSKKNKKYFNSLKTTINMTIDIIILIVEAFQYLIYFKEDSNDFFFSVLMSSKIKSPIKKIIRAIHFI